LHGARIVLGLQRPGSEEDRATGQNLLSDKEK
jgi:hypothetical protein